ncbi:MAG: 2-oxoglutarate and iron-dependent oxygenase domain-containing protein [Rhodospirillaceae bacterium]|nr:2-oxoglutarate and iron-dependent oxygenase domain-containing protein [Rhodospirillaceae bacterium]
MPDTLIPPLSIAKGARDLPAFAGALGESFARYGFAVISDHGIAPDVIASAFDRTRAFFALPEAVKRKYLVPGGGGQRGYTPFGIETAKGAARADLKEFWHVGRELPPGHRYRAFMPPNIAVAEIADFNAAAYRLYEAMDALGLRILNGIARYLGLAPDYFDAHVSLGNSILRLLHYPPVPEGAVGVRAGAHEDINVITLLLGAEEAGLQLRDRDGQWRDIDPPPDCVVVNIGDMLQRLTNHVLPSTTHRVVNPSPARAAFPRYSMPFFQHFAPDFVIATLPGCVSPERPNRYPTPITTEAYLRERLAEIKLI